MQLLTRAREVEATHSRRELRELATMIAMKARRHDELIAERARKIAAAEKEAAASRATVEAQIAREQEGLTQQLDALKRENAELAAQLQHGNQVLIGRHAQGAPDFKPSGHLSGGHGGARQRLIKERGRVASDSPSRRVVGSPGRSSAARNSPSRAAAADPGELDKDGIPRDLKGRALAAWLQGDCESRRSLQRRLQLELEGLRKQTSREQCDANVRSKQAQRDAEIAERECAQLEEQAEYLATVLTAIRGQSRRHT